MVVLLYSLLPGKNSIGKDGLEGEFRLVSHGFVTGVSAECVRFSLIPHLGPNLRRRPLHGALEVRSPVLTYVSDHSEALELHLWKVRWTFPVLIERTGYVSPCAIGRSGQRMYASSLGVSRSFHIVHTLGRRFSPLSVF